MSSVGGFRGMTHRFPRSLNHLYGHVLVFRRGMANKKKTKGAYDDTLCLPSTSFPMRAGAATREPAVLRNCFEGIYEWQQTKTLINAADSTNTNHQQQQHGSGGSSGGRAAASPTPYVIHDGPPFANGTPHMGHAVNKVLKDIAGRYQMLRGRCVSFVPGWDCHGLPIEHKAAAELAARNASPVEIRAVAAGFARDAIAEQAAAFRRWAVLADWEHPYMTMDPSYEAAQLGVFYEMYCRGQIHRRFRPVYWSPSSRTALAEAEVEYRDHKSTAVHVALPMVPSERLQAALSAADGHTAAAPVSATDLAAVVWTTTPWTLPANQAVAVDATAEYSVVSLPPSSMSSSPPLGVVMTARLPSLRAELELEMEPLARVKGADLVGSRCLHPMAGTAVGGSRAAATIISSSSKSSSSSSSSNSNSTINNNTVPVLASDHVTADAGTGVVHMAPAHGLEDYQACRAAGMTDVLSLIDADGAYNARAPAHLRGLEALGEGNTVVVSNLKESGRLLHSATFEHRYPYDWRTHGPLMLRATEQWFADLSSTRERAAAALDGVEMRPESGRARLAAMLGTRAEWCISRQRAWGVPIPVFYHAETGEVLLDDESFAHVHQVVSQYGCDAWWELPTEELLPLSRRKSAALWQRGTDTMDVWFDSGTSWRAVVEQRLGGGGDGGSIRSDLVLEGSDQHRGWFQSSLLTRAATASADATAADCAPYKRVVTHGFVVDAEGRKMSKSLGNGLDPATVVSGGKNLKKDPAYGADVLRLWIASTDYTGDMAVSAGALKTTAEHLRRLRNTGRFLLGNLAGFEVERDAVRLEDMARIDRWALHRAQEVERLAIEAYESQTYLRVHQGVLGWCTQELSAFYFESVKDRLYLEPEGSLARRSAQTALHGVLGVLTRALAPITCFLSEDLYHFAHGRDPASGPSDAATGGHDNVGRGSGKYSPSLHSSTSSSTDASPCDSVVQAGWTPAPSTWASPELATQWEAVRALRRAIYRHVQECREEVGVNGPADAIVHVRAPRLAEHVLEPLRKHEAAAGAMEPLRSALLVSGLELEYYDVEEETTEVKEKEDQGRRTAAVNTGDDSVYLVEKVAQTTFHKCPRCWQYLADQEDALCKRCNLVVPGLP